MEILAAFQGFKSILDGLKAMSDIRDETMRNHASIELSRQLIDLQGQMMAAIQENATLAEKVRALEAEMAKLKAGASDLERYELRNITGGGTVYMLKAEARGTEAPHWLCPNCYANGKKSVFQRSSRMSMGTIYRCSTCKAHMTTHSEPG